MSDQQEILEQYVEEVQEEPVLEEGSSLAQAEEITENELKEEEERPSGHMTREEWIAKGNDPSKYRDEKTWNDMGNMMKQIKYLKKSLESEQQTTKRLAEMFTGIRDKERKELMREYKARYDEAVNDGNISDALKFHDEIKTLEREDREELRNIPDPNKLPPEVEDFMNKHPDWFDRSKPAQFQPKWMEAVNLENTIRQEYVDRGISVNDINNVYLEDILQEVERRMTTEEKPKVRQNPVAPPAAANKVTAQQQDKSRNLNADQKREYISVRDNMKKVGIEYTVDEYLNAVKRYGA